MSISCVLSNYSTEVFFKKNDHIRCQLLYFVFICKCCVKPTCGAQWSWCCFKWLYIFLKTRSSTSSCSLSILLELKHYGLHPGGIFGRLCVFSVEVHQLVDAFPLCARFDVVHLGNELKFSRAVDGLRLLNLVLVMLVPI